MGAQLSVHYTKSTAAQQCSRKTSDGSALPPYDEAEQRRRRPESGGRRGEGGGVGGGVSSDLNIAAPPKK